jgi:tRNA (guanine37-N1)-methyltransferase
MKGNLRTHLKDKLEANELELLHTSYDVVGDIAVIRVPEALELRTQKIAEALLKTQKHVKSVLRQISPVAGDFRLRDLTWVAGEKKTETVYKEFGCFFNIDLERCYFSPRLSYERMRIAKLIQPNEVIVNMFAGVGCYSIIIAKHSCSEKIYSIDINPIAIEFLKENARLNRVERQVLPVLGDAKETIEGRLRRIADRVIMPLPEKAYEYIEAALLALKSGGGIIHYHDFEHSAKGENAIEKTRKRVSEKLETLGVNFDLLSSRIVRTTGPNWHQIALDIQTS